MHESEICPRIGARLSFYIIVVRAREEKIDGKVAPPQAAINFAIDYLLCLEYRVPNIYIYVESVLRATQTRVIFNPAVAFQRIHLLIYYLLLNFFLVILSCGSLFALPPLPPPLLTRTPPGSKQRSSDPTRSLPPSTTVPIM